MRAIAIDAYGETPTLRDLPTPEPQRGEVLIEMRAAGVNPMDWRVRDGAPARFDQTARFPLILGLEGAGVVKSVGESVDRYQPGDAVFGLFWPHVFEYGTFADYLVVPSDARMARKPADLSFEQAAALPLAGGAAMVLSDWMALEPGETILVVGATGGVGSYVVQLAKARRVRVIATATEDDAQYIVELGADETIDFQHEDLIPTAKRLAPGGVDAVLDLVSDAEQLTRITTLIRPGGRVASLIFSADVDALSVQGIRAANILSHPAGEHFDELARLVCSGALRVPIKQILPLAEAPAALALSESGKVRGKIVLKIS